MQKAVCISSEIVPTLRVLTTQQEKKAGKTLRHKQGAEELWKGRGRRSWMKESRDELGSKKLYQAAKE